MAVHRNGIYPKSIKGKKQNFPSIKMQFLMYDPKRARKLLRIILESNAKGFGTKQCYTIKFYTDKE